MKSMCNYTYKIKVLSLSHTSSQCILYFEFCLFPLSKWIDCLPTVKQGFGNSQSIIINNQLNSIYNSVYDFMVLLGKTSFLAHPPIYTIFAQKMTNKTHTHTQQLQVTDLPIETVLPSTFPGDSVARWQVALSLTCCRESLKGLVTIGKYIIQR